MLFYEQSHNDAEVCRGRTSLFPSGASAGPNHWGEPKAGARRKVDPLSRGQAGSSVGVCICVCVGAGVRS